MRFLITSTINWFYILVLKIKKMLGVNEKCVNTLNFQLTAFEII